MKQLIELLLGDFPIELKMQVLQQRQVREQLKQYLIKGLHE